MTTPSPPAHHLCESRGIPDCATCYRAAWRDRGTARHPWITPRIVVDAAGTHCLDRLTTNDAQDLPI